jgi:Branched-chain amino acid transport system / permease component
VLGGMGSLAGAVAGALLIGVGETLTTAYIAPQWQTAVAYVVIFVVLLLRPQGLLGAPDYGRARRSRGKATTALAAILPAGEASGALVGQSGQASADIAARDGT